MRLLRHSWSRTLPFLSFFIHAGHSHALGVQQLPRAGRRWDLPCQILQASMAHNYDVGTKAWQPDVTEGWVASEVVSKTERDGKVKLVFQLANGEVWSKNYFFSQGRAVDWPSLIQQMKTIETSRDVLQDDHNTTLPPLMNPTMLEASDDLTNLSHLNEPAGMAIEGKILSSI